MQNLGRMFQAYSTSPAPPIMGQAAGALGRYMNPTFGSPIEAFNRPYEPFFGGSGPGGRPGVMPGSPVGGQSFDSPVPQFIWDTFNPNGGGGYGNDMFARPLPPAPPSIPTGTSYGNDMFARPISSGGKVGEPGARGGGAGGAGGRPGTGTGNTGGSNPSGGGSGSGGSGGTSGGAPSGGSTTPASGARGPGVSGAAGPRTGGTKPAGGGSGSASGSNKPLYNQQQLQEIRERLGVNARRRRRGGK